MEQQMTLEDYKKKFEAEERKQYGHLGQPSILTVIPESIWQMYFNDNWPPQDVLLATVMGL